MGFSLRRWLLAALSHRELGLRQLEWKYLRCSYSQFGEDLIALSLLPQPAGFYVDAGAYHPVTLSNTYHFYRRGWRGIVIDANPECLSPFARRRPRDICVHAALSDEPRDAVFEIHADGATSTLRPEITPPDGQAPLVVRKIQLRTRTLRSVLKDHLPPNTAVDFLTVDCEHEDLAVLRSNDWERHRPRVIAVEDWEPTTERSEICAFLAGHDYKLVSTVEVGRIFRDRQAPPARTG